jgi:NAD(P)-dependent dehydrogenase (short-subunit alcohol dehydrogenase family)
MTYEKTFITGVHTGLGNALAKTFLAAEADVYAISRSEPDELTENPKLHFRQLDLSKTEEIRDAIGQWLAPARHLDLVILNAGILGGIRDLRDTSLREMAAIMDVNVWANKLIYDSLLDLNTRVNQLVAISSGASVNGSGGWGAYSISKAALNLLFRVYAHEHPETHFVCLAPGLVRSQMLDYVCSLPDDQRYPAIGRIRSAMGTDRMQSPAQAAERIIAALPKLLEYPTGSYVDIREI